MKLAVISFTKQGNQLNKALTKGFAEQGEACSGYVLNRFFNTLPEQEEMMPMGTSLHQWSQEQFESVDGIVFIGAAGIAVRAIAPFVRDKMTDPAVAVVDEKGKFAISLLSGHMGGANDLALTISRMIGSVPVITTATDVNQVFAVDVFAKDNQLKLDSRQTAKMISADLLEGNLVGFYSDFQLQGILPKGFTQTQICKRNLWITDRERVEAEGTEVLRLIPGVLVLGIGCRKGTGRQLIRRQVEAVMQEANLSLQAVGAIATIDMKKEEPGLVEFSKELGVELYTYTAQELSTAAGIYTNSQFVAETTGIGNVCERAAVLAAGDFDETADDGCLTVRKQSGNGVTVAIAKKKWKAVI